MTIYILGYGPISDQLYELLSPDMEVFLYSSVNNIRSEKTLNKYEAFLEKDIRENDLILIAWRELPQALDIKGKVLEHLIKSLNEKHKIIFLSSVAVYGHCESMKTEESLPLPINSYGQAKYELETFFREHIFAKILILRIANVFGDNRFDDVVNRILLSTKNGKAFELVAPELIKRDFISLHTVLRAIRLLIEMENWPDASPFLNISSGKSITLSKLFEILRGSSFENSRIKVLPTDDKLILHSLISNHKFNSLGGDKDYDEELALIKYRDDVLGKT